MCIGQKSKRTTTAKPKQRVNIKNPRHSQELNPGPLALQFDA